MGPHHARATFEKVLNRLTEFVVLGKAHLEIGAGISKRISEDPVIGHIAPVFWGMTITAHLDVAQMIAFKLFDPRKGTMTVSYLLNLARQCSAEFQSATPQQVTDLITVARGRLSAIDDELTRLCAKRNRILAHVDPTVVIQPAKLAKETAVKFADLTKVFETAGEVLNTISRAFRDSFSLLELLEQTDYESVVQLVADAKHAQVEKYENEFKTSAPFPRPKTRRSNW